MGIIEKNEKPVAPVEKCVSCGAETIYSVNDPIDLRSWYVEGAGQLCESCYNNIYSKK